MKNLFFSTSAGTISQCSLLTTSTAGDSENACEFTSESFATSSTFCGCWWSPPAVAFEATNIIVTPTAAAVVPFASTGGIRTLRNSNQRGELYSAASARSPSVMTRARRAVHRAPAFSGYSTSHEGQAKMHRSVFLIASTLRVYL